MYKIALVQNQSEMSHYGYADIRPLLKEFGYETDLYTAENINELGHKVESLEFDAVIFGSNALNDKTIRSEVQSPEFGKAFAQFFKEGKGCLILHQLRLAQFGRSGLEESNIQFLPGGLNKVQPIDREENETAVEGKLIPTLLENKHTIWLYPNHIDIKKIESQCLNFPSLKGLYWHYWDKVDNSEWDIQIYAEGPSGPQRPLIISSIGSEKYRIILSSLTLDWQKQKSLLQNILIYVIEGRHSTAILTDIHKTSVAFKYLIVLLRSQKYPFKYYNFDTDQSLLKKNIENGIHTIVVLGQFIGRDRLDKDLYSLIESNALDGKVKLIGIEQHDTILEKFYIAGREKFALRLLYDVEIKIQNELRINEGYIDGSFWSTAESLQTLSKIPSSRSKFDTETLVKTFDSVDKHDRDGSYDEVFGVSCALLWLRGTYLGRDSKYTVRTLAWIKKNLDVFEDSREKTLAYATLFNIHVEEKEDKDKLISLLSYQNQIIEKLSEIDLIVYLNAAILTNMKDIIKPILMRLESLQNNGSWIDLATTATATITILDTLELLKKDSAWDSDLISSVESMIFESIIYIEAMQERNNISNYPWDNKASTSLKCIHAWLKFEELIDLPVHEMIESLESYSEIESQVSSRKTALDVLEDIKSENRKVLIKNVESDQKIKELLEEVKNGRSLLSEEAETRKSLKIKNKFHRYYLFVSLYFTISVAVYSTYNELNTKIIDVLIGIICNNWYVHVTFLTLFFSILAFRKMKHDGDDK